MTASVVGAAFLYFATVFAVGVCLGAVRVLLLVPILGESPSVALETPFMVLASWFASGRCLQVFHLRRRVSGLATGTIAFALLMATEFSIACFVFHQTPSYYVAAMTKPAGLIGLIGQLTFAILPFVRVSAAKAAPRR
jgi:hypothetical protein